MDPKRSHYMREEEAIQEALSMGEISDEEAREEQRELDHLDWDEVRESVELARDLEIGNW